MGPLIQLVYSSKMNKESFTSDEAIEILKSARKNNPKLDITGMLVCNFENFLQILEGPEDNVDKLYDIIAKDSRHEEAKLIDRSEISERQFSDWAMGFSKLDKTEGSQIDFAMIGPENAIKLLLDKAKAQGG